MIRVRHSQGSSTLKVGQGTTVEELQAGLTAITGLPLDEQEIKAGYPPKTLSFVGIKPSHLVSQAPLGIKPGEQLLVGQRASRSRQTDAPLQTSRPKEPPSHANGGATLSSQSEARAAVAGAAAPRDHTSSHPGTRPPVPAVSRGTTSTVGDAEVHVPYDGSALTLRVVPDDNSCLFNAVGLLSEQRTGVEVCAKLRRVVADEISASPETWSEAVLGMARQGYMAKIREPNTWGGAIELSILADWLRIELHAIDVSSGVVHRFGEGRGYEHKAFLVYSGIHYDALALLPSPDAPLEFGTMLFATSPSAAASSEEAALKLVAMLKKRGYYTDTANFLLQCKVCSAKLSGEKQASKHASETGHTDFGEVSSS